MFLYGEAIGRITRKHKKIVRWYALLATFAIVGMTLSYPVMKLLQPIIYVYGFAILLYIMMLIISTVQVYHKYRGVKSLMTIILLPMQHSLYGLGFIKGLLEVTRNR